MPFTIVTGVYVGPSVRSDDEVEEFDDLIVTCRAAQLNAAATLHRIRS